MKLSILIPTYNNLEYLKLCLDSIEKNSVHRHDICVHVDGSDDGTVEYILQQHKMTINVSYDSHRGMPYAFNKCFEFAYNDWVFFANDDFYFGPCWDEALIKYLTHQLRVVSINPIQPTPSPPIFDCGRTAKEFDRDKFDNFVLTRPKKELIEAIRPSTFWCAMHRDTFEQVGKFDVRFNPKNCADIDLQYRLLIGGYELVTAPDVYIYHFQKKATEKLPFCPGNEDKFRAKWHMEVEDAQKLFNWSDDLIDKNL